MLKSATIIVLLALASSSIAAESPDLAKLQGKWRTKRTGSDGQESSFTMEIKGEKLTFQAFRGENELRFVAKGNVKCHGPMILKNSRESRTCFAATVNRRLKHNLLLLPRRGYDLGNHDSNHGQPSPARHGVDA